MNQHPDHIAGATSAYRAYVIGDQDRIESSTDIIAVTDLDAIEQAQRLVDGHAIELWDRGRKVVRIEP